MGWDQVTVSGYDHKLLLLAERIVQKLVNFNVNPERFDFIKVSPGHPPKCDCNEGEAPPPSETIVPVSRCAGAVPERGPEFQVPSALPAGHVLPLLSLRI